MNHVSCIRRPRQQVPSFFRFRFADTYAFNCQTASVCSYRLEAVRRQFRASTDHGGKSKLLTATAASLSPEEEDKEDGDKISSLPSRISDEMRRDMMRDTIYLLLLV